MADRSLDATPTIESDPPRLTMLVPCWNAAATIQRALRSILDERSVPFECIVIDDGSTDGTAEIVQSIADEDPRVRLLRLPENGGVSNARNQGLAAVRTEWVGFHDADDRMLPGWLDALMDPTADPDVRAVVGQRIWTDGERTWLGPNYDNPDVREPGRKSIAANPGLLFFAACTGKVFHRSLLGGLQFEGRVLGDQAWTIRALLRAGPHIEVVTDTVFEWSRPHPDDAVETITTQARGSAAGATRMAVMARTVFLAVAAEVDALVEDERTRETIKRAYFDRLILSDLGGPVRAAAQRGDPGMGGLFDALVDFLDVVPRSILATSVALPTHLLRPPGVHWMTLPSGARRGYWTLVRRGLRADPRMSRRIAWRRLIEPAFVFARVGPPIGPAASTAVMAVMSAVDRVIRLARRS
ncbi:MAG: glycosyltransferase family 2 protein [Chloroflexota bacterium]